MRIVKKKKPGISGLIITVMLLSLLRSAMAESPICHPLLWPATTAMVHPIFSVPISTVDELQQWSKKLMKKSAHPIATLHSAGKTDLNDPELIASREAFKDAGNMAVLALTYRLTNNKDYLNKTKQTLLSWAKINHPTGHPIDETNLEGMIWAYDLIACDLSDQDKHTILDWFERMRSKKIVWEFDKLSSTNNHRIHQIKMLLLLDKILQRHSDWFHEIKNAESYASINLDPQSGVSVDYRQRSALFYHNYDVQPWLEISLVTDCCRKATNQAFVFLEKKIVTHRIGNEFFHSQVKLDTERAKNGFTYAQRGGRFDVTRAASTIVTYYTINRIRPDPRLWSIVQRTKSSPWLVFTKARRILWQPVNPQI